MKVLITGCTGHAGSHALDHFVNNGHEIHALVRPHHIPNLKERDNVKVINCTKLLAPKSDATS